MADLALTLLLSAQDNASKIVSGLTASFGPLGGAVALATTAAVGFGVQSVKAAGDFQQMTSTLVTTAGESASRLGMMRQGILDISVATGTSVEQLAHGAYMIESSGQRGAQALGTLRAAAMGAKSENADLAVVTKAVTTLMTDYKAQNVSAAQAMNALTATVGGGGANLQLLSTAMGNVLPLASSLGISFPQVGGAIDVMTNSGMNAQRASMNLANAIRSLAAPSGVAQKSMKAVGLSAQDLKDTLSTKGLAAAIQLVEEHVGHKFPAGSVQSVTAFKNIMGGATGYNVALMVGGAHMKDYQKNIDAISKAMKQGGDEINGWSEVQGNLNVQMDRLNAAFEVVKIRVGTALIPILSSLFGTIATLISKFSDWIEKHHIIERSIEAVKRGIEGFRSTVQPVIDSITRVAQAYLNWAETHHVAERAMDALKKGIDKLQAGLHPIADTVRNLVKALADWIDKHHVVNAAIDATKKAADAMKTALHLAEDTTHAIAKALQDAHDWFVKNEPAIKNVAMAIGVAYTPAIIKAGVEAVIAGAKIAASFVANIIKTGVESVIAGAKMAASFIVNLIRIAVEGWAAAAALPGLIANMIKTGVEAVLAGAKIAASFVANMVKAGVEAAASGAKIAASFVASMTKAGVEAATSGAKVAASFVASMVKAGVEAVASAAKIVASFAASMITAGAQAVTAAAQITASFVASLISAGVQAVITGAQMLASLVPAIISVIVQAGIAAAAAIPGLVIGFIAWATTAGAAAVATIAATWPILLIIAAIALLVVGIILLVTHWNEVVAFLQTTWQRFSSWITQSVTNLAKAAVDWGKNLIQGIINGINSMIGAVGSAVSGVADQIKKFLGFHSPTASGPGSTADQWAPNLIKMYATGITTGTPQVTSAVQALMSKVQQMFADGFAQITKTVQQATAQINTLLATSFTQVETKTLDSWKAQQAQWLTQFRSLTTTIAAWWDKQQIYWLNQFRAVSTLTSNWWTTQQALWVAQFRVLTTLVTTSWQTMVTLWTTQTTALTTLMTTWWTSVQTLWKAQFLLLTTLVTTSYKTILTTITAQQTPITTAMVLPFKNALTQITAVMAQIVSTVKTQMAAAASAASVSIKAPSVSTAAAPVTRFLASGGLNLSSGWSVIGERGPELMYVPGGSSILPNSAFQAMNTPSSSSGIGTVNITVNAPSRSQNEAKIIADAVGKELARRYRLQLGTIAMGGSNI